ncbi:uncharacterized protein LOC142644003 [Castanea sativa]|uniref:uncharacterized protein LOC142644003 n=1 Tax=Castanea sativa TaxID=21020 RepID=UPI003F64C4B7
MVVEMQMMKEQMDFMMNTLRGRVFSDLDKLVHQTDSLFTTSVTSFPLPLKFHMSQVEAYDGSKDPLTHLESFKTLMHLQGMADEIMCRPFPTTLKGPVRVWVSRLTPNFISTFKELSAQFASHFIRGHKYKKSIAYLMSIKQREDETLRSYITCFNKEALSINETDDKILVAAFTNWLRNGKFLFSLYKNDPKTMSDDKKPKKRERQEEARQDKGRKTTRTIDRWEDRRSKPPTGKLASFISLNAPIDQVLMQIKDEGTLTFLGKLKGDLSKRSRDKYCHFHRDHGHNTSDYYDLKQQIEALIRQRKLQRFVSKERTDAP